MIKLYPVRLFLCSCVQLQTLVMLKGVLVLEKQLFVSATGHVTGSDSGVPTIFSSQQTCALVVAETFADYSNQFLLCHG